MTDKIPKIYLDACPLIDMAQHEADGGTSGEIGKCVWFCTQILRAARDKKVKVLTSFLSVAECTSINTNGAAQPSGWAELSEHLASLKNQKTMQPHTKHPAAVALGRMARGVPKRITEADRKRRQEWARGLAARRKKSRRTVAPAKKNRLADSRSTRN